MYCLSIRDPWATLIMLGTKSIEIRYWEKTNFPAVGPLPARIGIHISKTFDDHAPLHVGAEYNRLALASDHRERFGVKGAVVGTATLAEIKTYNDMAAFTADYPLHLNTRFFGEDAGALKCLGLVFQAPEYYSVPVIVKGQPGFFQVQIQEKNLTGSTG